MTEYFAQLLAILRNLHWLPAPHLEHPGGSRPTARQSRICLAIGPSLPVWPLVLFRAGAAIVIALLWGAPIWLLLLTTALSLAATGAWTPMLALAFGALTDFLPERFPDGVLTSSLFWYAAVAVIIFLTQAMILSARLTEQVSLTARVELRAITNLTWRLLPGHLIAQTLWAAACLLPFFWSRPQPQLLTLGAGGLLALAALTYVIGDFRRRS